MLRTRVVLLVLVAVALAGFGAGRFVRGSEAATQGRAALTAAARAAAPVAAPVDAPVDTPVDTPVDVSTTTTAPPPAIHATLSPGDGDVVGVGMPAVVSFDRPVAKADRPAVEARLTVTANPPTEGDWRWITATLVHWRPAVYW